MKNTLIGFLFGLMIIVIMAASTNLDRLVLGSGNYNTDPNTTADITFQNDEYLTNYVDGVLSTDASLSSAGYASTSNVTFGVDSTIGLVLAASDSTLWRIKVSPTGIVSADSTGLN